MRTTVFSLLTTEQLELTGVILICFKKDALINDTNKHSLTHALTHSLTGRRSGSVVSGRV